MITKNDVLMLLSKIENDGINTKEQIQALYSTGSIPISVLQFINTHRNIDVSDFYTLLRKNYNNKKSNLYKNLIKEEQSDIEECLTTLAALNLQILLFARKLEDEKIFLNQSRANEIVQALSNYYTTYDPKPCLKLLRLIRLDMLTFDYVNGRRNISGELI